MFLFRVCYMDDFEAKVVKVREQLARSLNVLESTDLRKTHGKAEREFSLAPDQGLETNA